jgi:hypothetical protein
VQSVLGHLIHLSDLRLCVSNIWSACKSAGHGHACSTPSPTRTLGAWPMPPVLRLTVPRRADRLCTHCDWVARRREPARTIDSAGNSVHVRSLRSPGCAGRAGAEARRGAVEPLPQGTGHDREQGRAAGPSCRQASIAVLSLAPMPPRSDSVVAEAKAGLRGGELVKRGPVGQDQARSL